MEEALQFYELTTLGVTQRGMGCVGSAILDYVSHPDANGKLLGMWQTVIGRMNEIVLLREFDSRPSLAAERERARRSTNPFHCNGLMTNLDMTSYVPLDFFPPVVTGELGPLYEIRTHFLRPAGLSPLESHWRSVAKAGAGGMNTIVAMYSMDGRPRLVEVCSCDYFDEGSIQGDSPDFPYPCSLEESEQWLLPETTTSVLRSFDFSPLR